jgi:hypothetical protein
VKSSYSIEENIIDDSNYFCERKRSDQGIPLYRHRSILCYKDVLKCEQEQLGEINLLLGATHTFILKEENDKNKD